MDTIKLKYFLVVCETESIRKAAEILHLSPAALSKSIKQLELAAETTLITQSGRGIVITSAGKQLASQVKPLIEDLDKVTQMFKLNQINTHKQSPPLRLGSFEIFTTHFLSKLLDALPIDRGLIIQEMIPGHIEQALINNRIDYGITYMPLPTKGVHHQRIALTNVGLYANNPLFSQLSLHELPFVIPVIPLDKNNHVSRSLDGWPDEVDRFVKYQVYTMESALELCRQGKAVAYLPSFIAYLHNKTVKDHLNLKSIKLSSKNLKQSLTVYLAKRKTDMADSLFNTLSTMVKHICQLNEDNVT